MKPLSREPVSSEAEQKKERIELLFQLKLLFTISAKVSKARWRREDTGLENAREQSLKV